MNQVNKNSINRARTTIKCLSFNLDFYKDTQSFGISSEKVFELQEKYIFINSRTYKNPASIENDFRWLIALGVLRREVDGQGLTSKVRLTPLGRQIIESSPELPNKKAFPLERIKQCIFRRLKS
tara:strand:+ start:504 stop:875 length:372 start_codon:yes stop_codon:yes gene_type:complete